MITADQQVFLSRSKVVAVAVSAITIAVEIVNVSDRKQEMWFTLPVAVNG